MTTHAKPPSTFTIRLKEARKRAGLSQYQLGVLAGIDEFSASARMNQYERGVHEPDFNMVMAFAKVLNVPVSFLFEPDDKLAELILLAGDLETKELTKLVAMLKPKRETT